MPKVPDVNELRPRAELVDDVDDAIDALQQADGDRDEVTVGSSVVIRAGAGPASAGGTDVGPGHRGPHGPVGEDVRP